MELQSSGGDVRGITALTMQWNLGRSSEGTLELLFYAPAL